MGSLKKLIQKVSSFPIDRNFIPQERLDVKVRERTSLYPWRGQFSPGLVDLLLDIYAENDAVVLDPFAGSGTTLFEAARRSLKCYGAEISPAAVQLASMAQFVNLDEAARERFFDLAEELLEEHTVGFLPATLFNLDTEHTTETSIEMAATRMLDQAADGPVYNLLATSIMLAMGDGATLDAEDLRRAYYRNRTIAAELRFSSRACEVFLADARNLPLPDESVNLVITSPPYINVFNYHQNYRKAMELMSWRLLDIAPSEIGSNRKHRGNRFRTVVQYCMDMTQAFGELKRVLRPAGTAVSVIGRESRVRGVPFYNGRLLALCATIGSGFRLERWQERRFVNRFGKTIYEDVLTLKPDGGPTDVQDPGRRIGISALEDALPNAAKGAVRSDIEQAIARSEDIRTSRHLAVTSRPPLVVEHHGAGS